MKEHNYAVQNTDTRPRLQIRTQNICLVISISAVILKVMVKITSIFGSYRFLRIAWHDTFSLSHHLLASWKGDLSLPAGIHLSLVILKLKCTIPVCFMKFSLRVFRYSFSEAVPIFFNRLKSDFFLVRSL